MTKTIKIQLISKNDEIPDYTEVNKILWELQRETRTVANKVIQLCWEYNGFESEWKKKRGEYPSKEETKEILGKSLQTVIYDQMKEIAPNMNTGNLSMIVQSAMGKFNSHKSEILKGDISIPSYKKDLPIEINKKILNLDAKKTIMAELKNGHLIFLYFHCQQEKNTI